MPPLSWVSGRLSSFRGWFVSVHPTRRKTRPPCSTAIESFQEALMNGQNRITIDPNICHGKPTIRGLRYPVENILELLSSGMTTDEILADYKDLEREDVLAALAFATRMIQVKRFDLSTS